MAEDQTYEDRREEQERLAREIGAEVTEAFVAFVQGDLSFADLSFGVYDALGDLNVIASGEYDLEEDDADEDDEYDDEEATDEQEELSQEPARD